VWLPFWGLQHGPFSNQRHQVLGVSASTNTLSKHNQSNNTVLSTFFEFYTVSSPSANLFLVYWTPFYTPTPEITSLSGINLNQLLHISIAKIIQ